MHDWAYYFLDFFFFQLLVSGWIGLRNVALSSTDHKAFL